MNRLPDSVKPYKKTKLFTSDSVPDGFLKTHRTARGVWGLLSVEKGGLVFCNDVTGEKLAVSQGGTVVIEPEAKHHLELREYAEFYVEFYS